MAKEKRVQAADIEDIVSFLKENSAGSVIRRSDAAKVSCGMLNAGTLANADSANPPTGPDERVVFGSIGKVSYPC